MRYLKSQIAVVLLILAFIAGNTLAAECKATYGNSDQVFRLATGSPGELGLLKELADAYARIAKAKSNFLSRGDNSGTNKKELAIWKKAGIQPRTLSA